MGRGLTASAPSPSRPRGHRPAGSERPISGQSTSPGPHLGVEGGPAIVDDERAAVAIEVKPDGALQEGRLHFEGGLTVPERHGPPGLVRSPGRHELPIRRDLEVERLRPPWPRAPPPPRPDRDAGGRA